MSFKNKKALPDKYLCMAPEPVV